MKTEHLHKIYRSDYILLKNNPEIIDDIGFVKSNRVQPFNTSSNYILELRQPYIIFTTSKNTLTNENSQYKFSLICNLFDSMEDYNLIIAFIEDMVGISIEEFTDGIFKYITQDDVDMWSKIKMPVRRLTIGTISVDDIVSIQPLSAQTGQIFTMKPMLDYGNTK